jgi:hypothetical protein
LTAAMSPAPFCATVSSVTCLREALLARFLSSAAPKRSEKSSILPTSSTTSSCQSCVSHTAQPTVAWTSRVWSRKLATTAIPAGLRWQLWPTPTPATPASQSCVHPRCSAPPVARRRGRVVDQRASAPQRGLGASTAAPPPPRCRRGRCRSAPRRSQCAAPRTVPESRDWVSTRGMRWPAACGQQQQQQQQPPRTSSVTNPLTVTWGACSKNVAAVRFTSVVLPTPGGPVTSNRRVSA